MINNFTETIDKGLDRWGPNMRDSRTLKDSLQTSGK